MTFYVDMDGVLSNFHKEPFNYKNAINKQWIENLEPFMNNIKVIQQLIANNNQVYILTKAASYDAMLGKKQWIKKYLPQVNIDTNFICIIKNGKKIDYIKEEGMLIDDDIKNINPWKKAGYPTYYLEIKGQTIQF